MTASLRLTNALLVMLAWSSASTASFARTPEKPTERPKSSGNLGYEIHKVKKGETLWSVAMDFHTSAGEIMDMNNLDNSRIKEGQNLKIPHATSGSGTPIVRQKVHVVAEDETMHGIAKSYDLSEDALLRANPEINPRRLRPGTRLVIPGGALPPPQKLDTPPKVKEPTGGSLHVVRDNETFTSIAKQYRVPVADVLAANPTVQPERLHEGMKIKIPGVKPQGKDTPTGSAKKSTYIVQPGDSLQRISQRVGVPAPVLIGANHLANPNNIPVGTALIIPSSSGVPRIASNDNGPPQRQSHPGNNDSLQGYGPPQRNVTRQPSRPTTVENRPPVKIVSAPKKPALPPESYPKKAPQTSTPIAQNSRPPTQSTKPKGPVEFSYEKQAVVPKPNYQPQAAPASRGGSRSHFVAAGETVETIAAATGVPAAQLRSHNRLGPNSKLRAGDEIIIPSSGSLASR